MTTADFATFMPPPRSLFSQQLELNRGLCTRSWSEDAGWPDTWLGGRTASSGWGRASTPLGSWWCSWNARGVLQAGFEGEPETCGRNDSTAQAFADRLFSGQRQQVPLQLGGTDFQRAVWRLLWLLPEAVITDYGQLARQLGRPGAARAVGQAVGANVLAGLIPCHRVVCADGRLGGFRWGPQRKATWLAYERTSQNRV